MFLPWILIVAVFQVSSEQVKCFCDRDSCDDNLLCQGDFCFIGLRREDGSDTPKLRQHCGSTGDAPYLNDGRTKCEERVENWQELCKCAEDFCNTFAYLRSSIDSQQDRRDIIQFTKQDVPYSPALERPVTPVSRNQSSSLIVLLVIIPLSVGGFAVCLIFLNYHCKMC